MRGGYSCYHYYYYYFILTFDFVYLVYSDCLAMHRWPADWTGYERMDLRRCSDHRVVYKMLHRNNPMCVVGRRRPLATATHSHMGPTSMAAMHLPHNADLLLHHVIVMHDFQTLWQSHREEEREKGKMRNQLLIIEYRCECSLAYRHMWNEQIVERKKNE